MSGPKEDPLRGRRGDPCATALAQRRQEARRAAHQVPRRARGWFTAGPPWGSLCRSLNTTTVSRQGGNS